MIWRVLLNVAALVFAAIVGYLFYTSPANFGFSFAKDVIFLFVSVFASYSIAVAVSRAEYQKELRKLGNLASRRTARLADNLKEVGNYLVGTNYNAAAELYRLSRDADESISDIMVITDTDLKRENTEIVYCPECGLREAKVFSEAVGVPHQIQCARCKCAYSAHLVNGGVKIQISAAREQAPSAPKTPIAPNPVRKEIQCPACAKAIKVKPRPGVGEIYCLECDETVQFDFDHSRVNSHTKGKVLRLPISERELAALKLVKCPSCAQDILKGAFFLFNSRSERFAICKHCSGRVATALQPST